MNPSSLQYTKPPENRLLTFADDSQPRWVTAMTMLDYYNTIAAGDRFGNAFVNRLDPKVSEQVDDDPTGVSAISRSSLLIDVKLCSDNTLHITVIVASNSSQQ
jgi:CPSF A subunit-like protein